MERSQIENKLREIISNRVKGVAPESIDPQGSLAELGIDSLAFSWILADMEDAFEFVMRGSDVMKLKTLAAAIDYVEQNAKN